MRNMLHLRQHAGLHPQALAQLQPYFHLHLSVPQRQQPQMQALNANVNQGVWSC